MLRIQGLGVMSRPVQRFGATGLALAFAAAAAGCSTDFRRLEQPSLALNEPRPSEPIGGRRSVGAPVAAPEAWNDSGPRAALPPPVTGGQPMAPLPPATQNTAGLSKPFDRPKAAVAAAPAPGQKIPVAPGGTTVEVQQGDSLYSIAKRHNVPLSALMDVNQLKSPNLKIGQKLVLPANARKPGIKTDNKVASAGGAVPPTIQPITVPAAAPPLAPAPISPPAAASASADWGGSYTVKPGDSLYAVARAHKVSLPDLQRVNGISDATKVRPGVTLKVPGAGAPASAEAPRTVTAAAPPAPGIGSIASPKIINAVPAAAPAAAAPIAAPVETVVPPVGATPAAPAVEKAPVVTTAAPGATAAAATAKFRWPVKGQVLAGFGKRPDGSQNDGVDVSVPVGTDVHAASAGTIAYAGSELKGYGNLILVRHDNGWVSAYAHASEILVKRGDAVTRGQVIAKSGQSGTVGQPQLHFELRQGSKPVDPTPHLDKM